MLIIMLTTCKGIVSISYIEQHTDIVKHERRLANMVVIVRNVVGTVYTIKTYRCVLHSILSIGLTCMVPIVLSDNRRLKRNASIAYNYQQKASIMQAYAHVPMTT